KACARPRACYGLMTTPGEFVLRREFYRALVEALPGVAFVLDEYGRYIEVLGRDTEALYREADSLAGKGVRDVFEPELADFFMDVVTETLRTGELQVCEYQLDVQRGLLWFEGRCTPIETLPGEDR